MLKTKINGKIRNMFKNGFEKTANKDIKYLNKTLKKQLINKFKKQDKKDFKRFNDLMRYHIHWKLHNDKETKLFFSSIKKQFPWLK